MSRQQPSPGAYAGQQQMNYPSYNQQQQQQQQASAGYPQQQQQQLPLRYQSPDQLSTIPQGTVPNGNPIYSSDSYNNSNTSFSDPSFISNNNASSSNTISNNTDFPTRIPPPSQIQSSSNPIQFMSRMTLNDDLDQDPAAQFVSGGLTADAPPPYGMTASQQQQQVRRNNKQAYIEATDQQYQQQQQSRGRRGSADQNTQNPQGRFRTQSWDQGNIPGNGVLPTSTFGPGQVFNPSSAAGTSWQQIQTQPQQNWMASSAAPSRQQTFSNASAPPAGWQSQPFDGYQSAETFNPDQFNTSYNQQQQAPSLYRGQTVTSNFSSTSGQSDYLSYNGQSQRMSGGAASTGPGENLQFAPPAVTPAPAPAKKAGGITVSNVIPYNREFVEDYRARMKLDPDPEAHFQYALYLIDAARRICAEEKFSKTAIKYRDSLLAEVHKLIKKLAMNEKNPLPDAMYFLADCYSTRKLDFAPDAEKAYQLYQQGAAKNHGMCAYRAGKCKEQGVGTKKDPVMAAKFYKFAASLGNTEAIFELAKILFQGGRLGLAADPVRAFQLLKRAAAQADEKEPAPLYTLASIYERGRQGVAAQDEALSLELYTQAANMEYADAQYRLGRVHEYGELGTVVDHKRSIAWYTRAAQKGHANAELSLSGWYLTGSPGILPQSNSEAYLWARNAANKGLDKAEHAVGYFTEMSIGVKKDTDAAKTWYLRAAAQGHAGARQRLTELKQNKHSTVAVKVLMRKDGGRRVEW